MLTTTLTLLGIAVFLGAVAIITQIVFGKETNEPPCKKGDCENCPFPRCDEAERKRNTGE